jgi:hypothetical protein
VPEQIEWLWPGRVPFGAITVIAGRPGLGKSMLTVRLVAELTRGGANGPPAEAVMLTVEDPLAPVVRPRLEAAGADVGRVVLPTMRRDGIETGFVLPDDATLLRELVLDTQARLIIVDPLSGHLAANVNSWKDQNVRQALAPLHALAEEASAAVVVVAHLNKGQSTDPIHRLGGSIGLAAAARSVLLLAQDPDDPDGETGNRRVLAHVKSNIGALAPSVGLVILQSELDGRLGAAHVIDAGESSYSGAELLALEPAQRASRLAEAIAFLEDELKGGPRLVAELEARAGNTGISPQTLRRENKRLGVESKKLDFAQGWVWDLPDEAVEKQAA